MKINIPSLFGGIFIAISGSLLASSTTVPYSFSAGQKAIASQVNSNFSALASAINQLDSRVSTVEATTSSGTKENISISQNDIPVGSVITVGGIQYTITQFEVPRYDTDEAYLVKYPSSYDFTTGTAYSSIEVAGVHAGDVNGFESNKSATINEFNALIGEGYSYTSQLTTSNAGRQVTASFYQYLSAAISLGPQTRISIFLRVAKPNSTSTSPTRSANASDISTAYPPTINAAERAIIKSNLRTLLSYITVKKKA